MTWTGTQDETADLDPTILIPSFQSLRFQQPASQPRPILDSSDTACRFHGFLTQGRRFIGIRRLTCTPHKARERGRFYFALQEMVDT